MRSYCGIYVDAGYLTAASSIRLTGTSYRAATEADVAGLIEAITQQATEHAGLPLLRVHWYDSGSKGVASTEQRRIATLPRVKLRLGRTSVHGEQKGVDLKLALDLITQAQNRVADVVYLVSGDDDLTEAVDEAQHLGTQVVLLAVPDLDGRPINVSRNLQMACDDLLLVDAKALDQHVRKLTRPTPSVEVSEHPQPALGPPAPEAAPAKHRITPADLAAMLEDRAPAVLPPKRLVTRPPVPVYSTTTGQPSTGSGIQSAEVEDAIASVVGSLLTSWWMTASPTSKQELLRGKPFIPQELDRTLLLDLSSTLGVDELDAATRFRLRDAFWERAQRL